MHREVEAQRLFVKLRLPFVVLLIPSGWQKKPTLMLQGPVRCLANGLGHSGGSRCPSCALLWGCEKRLEGQKKCP